MPFTKILASAATGLTAGVAAFGVPLLDAENAALPAPDATGWRADPVAGALDPATATPALAAAFFANLTPAERAGVVARFPVVVAALDGAPVTLRFAATAHLMRAQGHADLATGRTFLAFDSVGDGRAIEVVGDLTTARRIVVIVPGNDTTLADFDRGLGGVTRRAPAAQARAVHTAVSQADPGSRTAVVAWLGYDSPEGFGKATIREDRAAAGAAALARFTDGLAVTNPGAPVIVVGHSYGSVVLGRAAASFGPNVTDLIAVASPGMGVGDASELRTTARIWAARAESDWIGRIPDVRILGLGHGEDPTDAGFGARILPADGVDGHDGYLVAGSSTLAAVTQVILGGVPSGAAG
ncbi:MAG: hypothetical protein HOV79_03120 [Hamadaea sp.]|nr:hypothetical protein [Hamadaea sp.]